MRRHGVPPDTTTFVGRKPDLEALSRNVADARLVTVLGPPGVGKTRLVTELLRSRLEGVDEVVFVDLAEASTAEALRVAVARALELPLSADSDEGDDELLRALAARRRCLLVLDDFEKLVAHAPIVGRWLEAASELRALVTSRERLRLAAEVAFDLAPLPLDGGGSTEGSDAGKLFIERARASRRDFGTNAEELADVEELVRRLDGLPLAIELCAARVRVLSPRQLAARLDVDEAAPEEAVRLLRGATAGRRGLREAVLASVALLNDEERALFAACTVFRGGFTAEAVEEVYGGGADGAWPLDLVQALVDKSLLVSAEGAAGARRFRLLSTLRAFASRGLVDDAAYREAERRHAKYFALAASRLGRRVVRGDLQARRELGQERDNVVAAHATSVTEGDAVSALRCAIALSPILTTEGPLRHGLSLLDRALSCPGAEEAPRALIADAHAARAVAALLTGDLDAAGASAEQARETARERRDPILLARILRQGAKVDLQRSKWERVKRSLEESLELTRQGGDRHGEGWSLTGLGELAFYVDDLDEAAQKYEEARLLFLAVGDASAAAVLRYHVGSVAVERDRPAEARGHLEAALAALVELGERRTACWARSFLAILDQSEGRLEAAHDGFIDAVAMARRIDFRRGEGTTLGYLAGCLLEAGELDEAIVRYREAFEVLAGTGSTIVAYFHAALGAAFALRGDVAAATNESDTADRILGETSRQTFAAAVLGVHRGHLALAKATTATDERERARGIEEARRALAVDPAMAAQSDVRFARRILERALAAATHVGPAALESAEPVQGDPTAIVVADSGRWFRCPGEAVVDLSRRRSLRLIVAALADRRIESSGAALDIAELVAIGWPGEAILPDAATERAYTAVATLRRLGLKSVLVRRDDGYMLDPSLPLVVVPEVR